MHLSQSEENYIKAIYSLEHENETVSTNDLAERLKTKASSVTDMIKKLAEKNLLEYIKYKGCKLTNTGEKIALKTIRKHRLWETFLVEKLGFGWDEVHPIAEQLEHIRSVELTDKLDKFLNFPKYDPHGDPIPDREGNIPKLESSCYLNDLPINKSGVVIGVSDASPTFLRYLDSQEIGLGTEVKMIEVFEFDNSCHIEIKDKAINLSATAASKLTIQY